jgi:multidrug efflux pump
MAGAWWKGLAGDRLVVGGVQRIYYPGMPVNPRPGRRRRPSRRPWLRSKGSAMDFSKFFIDRPIFAVLSIIMFAVGLVAIPQLPVGEYPEVVPPWWCAPPIREPIPRRSPSRWPCRWRRSTGSKA